MDELLKILNAMILRPKAFVDSGDFRDLCIFFDGYLYGKNADDISVKFFDNFRLYLVGKYNDNRIFNWYRLILANEPNGNSIDTFSRLLHEYLEAAGHAINKPTPQ